MIRFIKVKTVNISTLCFSNIMNYEIIIFLFLTDLLFCLESFGNAALAFVVLSFLSVLCNIPLPMFRVVYSKTGKNSLPELI